MPKRRNSNTGRKKPRKPPPQLPRPRRVRDGEQQPSPAAAQATKPAPTADNLGSQPADRQVTGTILAVEREFIRIDVDGQESQLYASELMLDAGETPSQRYAVGDRFDAFVFQMEPDPESGLPQFSIRRAPPYPDALNRLKVGAVVSATVVNAYDPGIELDVDGVRGNAFRSELPLAPEESPHDRYAPGDPVEALVGQVNRDTRNLLLSVRRSAPGYIEALVARSVGEVVSGVVTGFSGNGGLWLDVDGVIGGVLPHELPLDDGQSAQDRYSVGDTVSGLFVWQVDHDARDLSLSVPRNAPGYVDALAARSVGEIVSGDVTGFPGNGGLWLDVDGVVGAVGPQELSLADGESAQDHYSIGDTIHGLFVWQVNHDQRDLLLSVPRNAPGYVDALAARSVGEIVSGDVTGFPGNGGLWLDVDGVVGAVGPQELSLADSESAQDRYPIGGTVHDLFVWQVDLDTRRLELSIRRNAPGYVKALAARNVGEVVSGITVLASDGGLWLDVDGVFGSVAADELSLADGESAQDRYPIDSTVEQLFVWQIDQDARVLDLSVRRNVPGYVEALAARSVGEVVSGDVTGFPSNGGLWLDVDGIIGAVGTQEMSLADGESAQDRYPIGDTVHDLFVWQVNHGARDLYLSARRNAPGYVQALAARSIGEAVSGIVTETNEWGIWLDAAGVGGWIPASELALDEGQSPRDRYVINEPIKAQIWQLDRISRTAILSVRRLDTDLIKERIARGATVDAVVRGTTPRGTRSPIRVLAADNDVQIPPHELSLSTAVPPPFNDGEVIRVVVIDLDEHGRPAELSHRRTLDRWDAAVERLTPGTLVARARILPERAFRNAGGQLAVDLGPIIGFIVNDELNPHAAANLTSYSPNEVYAVVVESVDHQRGIAFVSHDKFATHWAELADDLRVGAEVDAELRDIEGSTAFLDLGSGLIATMPADQLQRASKPAKSYNDRIGEDIPARITHIDRDAQAIYAEHYDQWLAALIDEPESQTLDFKEVLKGDKNTNDAQEMPRQAIRTINAFLNTDGGRLIIGVHDTTREIVGLEGDPGLIADTIEKKIDIAIQILDANLKKLEPRDVRLDILAFVKYDFLVIRGRTLLVVTCQRGPGAGVVVNMGKGKQEFWVRAGQEKIEKKTREEQRAHLLLRARHASSADES